MKFSCEEVNVGRLTRQTRLSHSPEPLVRSESSSFRNDSAWRQASLLDQMGRI